MPPPFFRDLCFALCAGGLFTTFALGAKVATERLLPSLRARERSIWVYGSLAAYGLVFVATCLEFCGAKTLFVGAAAVLALQCIGIGAWLKRRRGDLAAVALFALAVLLWSIYTRDLAGISSHHDGISHTAFILRFLDSGHLALVKTPPAFADLWPNGGETLRHYPCGTHALAAMFLWPWTELSGIVSISAAFKAFAAMIPGLLAPMLLAAGRSEPRRAVVLLVAALAFLDPRFPIWIVDSGGFSRGFGYLMMLPLVWQISALSLPFVFGLCVPVAFALHPTSALVLSVVATAQLLRRPQLSPQLAAGITVGLLLTYLQVSQTGSLAYAKTSILDDALHVDRSWREVKAQVLSLYKVLFLEPSDARLGPVAVTDVLVLFGLASAWRRPSARPALWVFLGLTIVAATKFSTSFAINALGEIFYHNRERLTEAYFCMKPCLWLAGLTTLERVIRPLRQRKLILALACAWLIADKAHVIKRNDAHLTQQFATFKSPSYSREEELMDFIRAKTPPDAVFLYAPLAFDSVEPRTGRRGLFMFQECPHLNDTDSCRRRLALWRSLETHCPSEIEGLRALPAKLYLVSRADAPLPACIDTVRETTQGEWSLFRLQL